MTSGYAVREDSLGGYGYSFAWDERWTWNIDSWYLVGGQTGT